MKDKAKGYRRARRIHAKRKYVNGHLKRRPDFMIGFMTGFYTVLGVALALGSWLLEFAVPYKYGLIDAGTLIFWGIASGIGAFAVMLTCTYALPTIMWRLNWRSPKSRQRYPDWVSEVERHDKRRK